MLFIVTFANLQDVSDLFGADLPVEGGKGGEFAWRDGPLLRALKAGHWVVLDEVRSFEKDMVWFKVILCQWCMYAVVNWRPHWFKITFSLMQWGKVMHIPYSPCWKHWVLKGALKGYFSWGQEKMWHMFMGTLVIGRLLLIGRICHVSINKVIICSDNGFPPFWCQAIIWSNASLLYCLSDLQEQISLKFCSKYINKEN